MTYKDAREKVLGAMPGTEKEIIERSGLPRGVVRRQFAKLMKTDMRISGWEQSDNGPYAAVYLNEPGKNKRRPTIDRKRKAYYARRAKIEWQKTKLARQGVNPFSTLFMIGGL